jgi:DNA-binding GntR family transcriptional regulator
MLTAFREIRELIVHGRMAPGTLVLEGDLADRLNMSRTPVRAAIQLLQRDGYVLGQRGPTKSRMIVAPLTKEDANELYLIIGRIECIAGRNAAVRPAEIREKLTNELENINKHLLFIANDKGIANQIFELDRNFHRAIVTVGAGSRLSTLHHAIEPQAERYWRLYASSIADDLHLSVAEHSNVVDALRRGDACAVERSLQMNWVKGAERLGQVIDIFGERGSW